MTEIEIYESGKKVSIPSCWDEMTARQVQFVFRLYDMAVKGGMSPLAFNVMVLYRLMGIRRTAVEAIRDRIYPGRAMRKAENVHRLCDECLSFLFSSQDDQVYLSYDSVSNPLPSVRTGLFTRLIGPADLLQDLTFGEFRHAAVSLNNFFKSRQVSDLDECLAHLYRARSFKANRAGRHVRQVTGSSIMRSIRRTARMSTWQKNLVMMWFSACLKYLQSGTVIIDGENVDMGLLFAGEGEPSQMGYSWNDLLIEIAKEQSIGNLDRVDDEPLFSIFSIMWHNYKERKRNEKISKTR